MRTASGKYTNLIRASAAVLFTGMLAYGIFREEVVDIVANATILCFSCIGLK